MRGLVLVILAATLFTVTGCSSTVPPPPTPTDSPGASSLHDSLSGAFVSQGAETQGTVSIAQVSDTQLALILRGFSTGAGDDLRPNLSAGELVRGADGYYVDAQSQFELPGSLDPADPEQVYFYPIGFWPDADIRSFTVYDYANRVAFGSAALAPADVVLPGWASGRVEATDSGARPGASGGQLPGPRVDAAYVVVAGDTASDIAARFGVGLEQLIDEDGVRLGRQPTLQPGQHILFGTPLTGHDYDCFTGGAPAAKGKSCYDS